MSSLRQQVLLEIAARNPIAYEENGQAPPDFGVNVFNESVMREKLPKDIYEKLQDTIRNGVKLDLKIANAVAHAMKEWAINRGCTHFTHWFQPQTGLTAEKHDAFLELDEGQVIERFRGEQLVQGEPDASSFPSGGMRTTFEARGYTMWDPSSPAYIMEGPNGGILCIPSVFISYNGEALDKKTPLLRSMEAINRAATRVIELFGHEQINRIVTNIGTEQEYFLVDKAFYSMRSDLRITGRSLVGAEPPKGQQLEDHYFGSIKPRVLAFMQDAERVLYKLGVPAKTRHNEVAPHQYEIAPIYAEANLGADRNHLIMEILKKVADRHGLALLLHEKPFAGVNGSGKHNNWSMEDMNGNNLLDPGNTPEENLQFLIFLAAIIRSVHLYGDLLRASVASAGNDHRLGANEAPPAIMSVFLGERLSRILSDIKNDRHTQVADDFIIDLGISKMPSIMRDNTDRNRTSPFAFTGNKFEFRAVGSSASVSLPNTVLSAGVADSLDYLVSEIKVEQERGSELNKAIFKVLKTVITESDKVLFEGNNYSPEWEEEAEKRGLPNIKRTAYALDALVAEKNVSMFSRQKVFSSEELQARYHTKLEQYITTLEIEAETLVDIIRTKVIPAAVDYENKLCKAISGLENILSREAAKTELTLLEEVSKTKQNLFEALQSLSAELEQAKSIEDIADKAKYFADHIVDWLEKARRPADVLENLIEDAVWPLPKYSEMLFIM
ncbi:glutamine synthetase type III [candidate division KSB1 bacterium]|nr:glutamine synthetase type III [candidate division KSB1 bacterium]